MTRRWGLGKAFFFTNIIVLVRARALLRVLKNKTLA
jgi:hypothetical protein